jgi:hypothetical protein
MGLGRMIKGCLTITVIGAFLLQITACGTIIYPERKGQVGGKVDVGVAILDGLGLLLFIIPGVIAFAVDFSNGTIYLPPGQTSLLEDTDSKNLSSLHIDKDKMNLQEIESVVSENTGINFDMDDQRIQIVELNKITEFMPKYAETVTQ